MFKKLIKKSVVFVIACAVLILADQLTKTAAEHMLADGDLVIIKDFFYLELVYNTGAAFGIFENGRVFFCVISIIFCLLAEIFYIRIPEKKTYLPLRIACMALFSGACGNLVDRIRTGRVVDFIAFDFGPYSFPRFNCSDIYVTLSAIALIIMVLFIYDDRQLKEALKGR